MSSNKNFIKKIVDLINLEKDFKDSFKKEYDEVPDKIFFDLVNLAKEIILDMVQLNNTVIQKHNIEFDYTKTILVLSKEEYEEGKEYLEINKINNIEIRDTNNKEESIKKQLYALEKMNFYLNKNLKDISTLRK